MSIYLPYYHDPSFSIPFTRLIHLFISSLFIFVYNFFQDIYHVPNLMLVMHMMVLFSCYLKFLASIQLQWSLLWKQIWGLQKLEMMSKCKSTEQFHHLKLHVWNKNALLLCFCYQQESHPKSLWKYIHLPVYSIIGATENLCCLISWTFRFSWLSAVLTTVDSPDLWQKNAVPTSKNIPREF